MRSINSERLNDSFPLRVLSGFSCGKLGREGETYGVQVAEGVRLWRTPCLLLLIISEHEESLVRNTADCPVLHLPRGRFTGNRQPWDTALSR
jgi:hypothetical protein